MRGLVQRVGETDPGAKAALQVIGQFDSLIAQERPLADLLEAASALLGVGVAVRDELGDRESTAGCASAASASELLAVLPDGSSLPAHGVGVHCGRLVAPVALASGRVGAVWTERLPAGLRELDQVVVERLAVAVAVESARSGLRQGGHRDRVQALRGLLDTDVLPERAAVLASQAGLDPSRQHRVVALAVPPGVSDEVVAARVVRLGHSSPLALVVLTRVVVVVLPPSWEGRELEVAAAAGPDVRSGVGRPARIADLHRSWQQASAALASTTPSRALVRADDIGALSLLAHLPANEVANEPDVVAVGAVAALKEGARLVDLLERYCTTGSLRETAAAVHRHHSSVQYNVRRLESLLGFELAAPEYRIRALIAVRLWRLQQGRAIGT